MGSDIDFQDFRKEALSAIDSLLTFSSFVARSEFLFDDSDLSDRLITNYRRAWLETEIVNAIALDEWETDGKPSDWGVKWDQKYKDDALMVVQGLLKTLGMA
jgi:hypothetical protein